MANETEKQWNSAKYVGISSVVGIALVAAIAQSVPTWVSVVAALPWALIIAYHTVRFIKLTYYHSKVEDANGTK